MMFRNFLLSGKTFQMTRIQQNYFLIYSPKTSEIERNEMKERVHWNWIFNLRNIFSCIGNKLDKRIR